MSSTNGKQPNEEKPYTCQEVYSLDKKRYLLVEFPLGTFLFDPNAKVEEIVLPKPTRAIPGSDEKIAVLQERVAKGCADDGCLFHPDDLSFRSGRILAGHELLDWGREEWNENAPEEPSFISLEDAGVI